MNNSEKIKKRYQEANVIGYTFSDIQTNIVRIDTPHRDLNSDSIILYAEFHNDIIIISDAGWSLDNIESTGITMDSKSIAKIKDFIKDSNVRLSTSTDYNLFIPSNLHNIVDNINKLLITIKSIESKVLSDEKNQRYYY